MRCTLIRNAAHRADALQRLRRSLPHPSGASGGGDSLFLRCVLGGASACACGPIEVSVFETPVAEEAPPPVISGPGGQGPSEDGTGGNAPITTFVLDDFEDGDNKANDPGGWWYMVNDGTGFQNLTVRPSEETTASPSAAPSLVLETQTEGFTNWGAAVGVDIENVGPAENALELSFSVAANRATEVILHAIDGSGSHFTRTFFISNQWITATVRLDELFLVEDNSVHVFDVRSATELQWFIFGATPTTIWLDNVALRYW